MKNRAQSIIEYVILLAVAIGALLAVKYIAPEVKDKLTSGIFSKTKDYISKPFATK